jgi:GNAT superfamily N-acetyltransferase
LTADTIEIKAINRKDCVEGYGYRKYSAMKVARLATDRNYEGRGVGTFMILACIGKAASVCESMGCRYLTIDSKPESVGFYTDRNFELAANPKKMIMYPST